MDLVATNEITSTFTTGHHSQSSVHECRVIVQLLKYEYPPGGTLDLASGDQPVAKFSNSIYFLRIPYIKNIKHLRM